MGWLAVMSSSLASYVNKLYYAQERLVARYPPEKQHRLAI